MTNKIISNQIECPVCGDRPYSAHRHDFKWCSCTSCSVDGGVNYLKRIGKDWKELSIIIPEDIEQKIVDTAQEMADSGRNARGIAYGVLRELRDAGIDLNSLCDAEENIL